MEQNEDFRLFVKNEREKLNLSARQVSEKIHKSESYISQLERGLVKEPPLFTAEKIMVALGHEPKELAKFKSYQDSSIVTGQAKTVTDIESIRNDLIDQLMKKVDSMDTKDIAGLLQLLNSERDIIWQLATVRADVKLNKTSFVMDSIRSYLKFLKQENQKETSEE
ncbi:helix-turn-helix domain-containing protein [Peribacillus frigoritolerans]|uniref:helix-turn-helix domain-containing protein n=1 Tax=Peribacillus frigoritolerans TaxID=450367 RepID=UPI00207AD393|nr:helix-turn-helix transcriptional regulator [Peribacillus frigoritolerans]USK78936.1 helix-turn-helix domain-containing protein [Peribacillus frigoritolerans]